MRTGPGSADVDVCLYGGQRPYHLYRPTAHPLKRQAFVRFHYVWLGLVRFGSVWFIGCFIGWFIWVVLLLGFIGCFIG